MFACISHIRSMCELCGNTYVYVGCGGDRMSHIVFFISSLGSSVRLRRDWGQISHCESHEHVTAPHLVISEADITGP